MSMFQLPVAPIASTRASAAGSQPAWKRDLFVFRQHGAEAGAAAQVGLRGVGDGCGHAAMMARRGVSRRQRPLRAAVRQG
jgi:hypothetical protein